MGLLRDQINKWNYGQSVKTASNQTTKQERTIATEDKSLATDIHHGKKMHTLYYSEKVKLHQNLLAKLDLAAAETMSGTELGLELKKLINDLIDKESIPVNEVEREQLIAELQNEIIGLGPLEPLLADPAITEILVNGFNTVYIERHGRLETVETQFNNNEHLLRIID